MKHRWKEFVKIMDGKLKTFGFKRKGKYGRYVFIENWGWKSFSYGHLNYIEGFGVGAGAGIRFNSLEELTLNSPTGSINPDLGEQTSSIGGDLNGICFGQNKSYPVTNDEQFDIALEKVMWHFTEHALPFFEKYSSLENAYQMLKRNDEEARWYSALTYVRTINAVGAAILLNKPKNEIQNLIHEERAWMIEYDNLDDLERFNTFLERVKDRL